MTKDSLKTNTFRFLERLEFFFRVRFVGIYLTEVPFFRVRFLLESTSRSFIFLPCILGQYDSILLVCDRSALRFYFHGNLSLYMTLLLALYRVDSSLYK